MSQINVNRIKDSNEGAPDFPSGVNVSGVTSTVTLGVTNLNTTNVNVSGVITATTQDGSLLATGTPTLGLGVTINTSGVNISGVATAGIVSATTLYGNGANITGIALTIAPLNYNPATYGADVSISPGIGLTFNQGVKAGSGNVTLRISGAAGTVVQNWGVGSAIAYSNGDTISLSLDSNLSNSEVYHLSYPSGAFTNIGGDVSYVGTAYTFSAKPLRYEWWVWGNNDWGQLGQGNTVKYSSPVQIPGTTWTDIMSGMQGTHGIRSDGTLWGWGRNYHGEIGLNNRSDYISPVQVPGTTWSSLARSASVSVIATKTDGTLWSWGSYDTGVLGQGGGSIPGNTMLSSPTQIPGTNWSNEISLKSASAAVLKTNGELWLWGGNSVGQLGQNDKATYSSPKQVPGTDWSKVSISSNTLAIKTNGELWTWGQNLLGMLGQNSVTYYSSPVQITGTTWNKIGMMSANGYAATKTDGTLWAWGLNTNGGLGDNSTTQRSSPTQVPGSWTLAKISSGTTNTMVLKEV